MSEPSKTSTPKDNRRVEKVHGGVNVEEVESPEKISDTSGHTHVWELDPSEKDFTAYICKYDKCGAVVLYDKM